VNYARYKPENNAMQTLSRAPDFPRKIQNMFGAVAPKYDFLNRLLSGGRDQYWRKTAVDLLSPKKGERFLDIATGTADIALEIAARDLSELKVMGIDFSGPMLKLGQKKVAEQQQEQIISLQKGCAESLPFADESFHGAISAFGLRNFSDTQRALTEMHRVLKPGGRFVILEFSHPPNPVLGWGYLFYFQFLLPQVGRFFSRHKSAYSYLPQSVAKFPMRDELALLMSQSGFQSVTHRDLTCGIVTLYHGMKNG
jgi:demethylmenaquinone methyltransferase/2-methoxy-6-polyprenyl-1,4-benzoquinol methylase